MPIASIFDKRRRKLRLALAAALFFGVTATTLAMFLHSEPYEYAIHIASTDPRIVKTTGTPKKVSLSFTRGFRYSFGDRSGEANMTLVSKSEVGVFDVQIHISKQAGNWIVNRVEVFPEGGSPVLVVSEPCPSACQ